MKLVIAAEIFPPDLGGPATYVDRLVPELVKENWEVKIITYADVKKVSKEEQNGYQVIKIPREDFLAKYFNYTKTLFKISKDADLIYAQGPVASGLPSLIVKWITSKKVVMKIVGDVAWERSKNIFKIKELVDEFQQTKYNWQIEFNRWLEHFIAKRMDEVITPSQYLKKIVSKWGVEPAKINVIYNATEDLKGAQMDSHPKQNLVLNGQILLSIGRLAPWKGFDTLINLMPELSQEFPDLKLVIIGEGSEKEKLELVIRNQELGKKVILVDSVPQNELGNYYQAADLFVLNSGYEGLSHVLLEALAMAVPVIASDIGGNPEVIQDNINGYLFEYNNQEQIKEKISQLLSNKEKQQQFKREGLKKLGQFSFSKMVQQTKEILKSTL